MLRKYILFGQGAIYLALNPTPLNCMGRVFEGGQRCQPALFLLSFFLGGGGGGGGGGRKKAFRV